jgi:UDP-N-acetylglucosamine 4,6-dehydratase
MSRMRFFLGDVRDRQRLTLALRGVDDRWSTPPRLKQVPAAEYNPSECIHTNVLGAENVVWASPAPTGVQTGHRPVHRQGLQPDQSLRRATKLASDKTFVAANNLSGDIGAVLRGRPLRQRRRLRGGRSCRCSRS